MMTGDTRKLNARRMTEFGEIRIDPMLLIRSVRYQRRNSYGDRVQKPAPYGILITGGSTAEGLRQSAVK